MLIVVYENRGRTEVCKIVSLKSDVWRQFTFSRVEKWIRRKGDRQAKRMWKHAARRRYTHGFLLHISARSKFNPCWINSDYTLFQIFISLILRQTAIHIKHTAINIVLWTNVLWHFDCYILIVSMPVCTASPQTAHTKTDTLPIQNCLQPF